MKMKKAKIIIVPVILALLVIILGVGAWYLTKDKPKEAYIPDAEPIAEEAVIDDTIDVTDDIKDITDDIKEVTDDSEDITEEELEEEIKDQLSEESISLHNKYATEGEEVTFMIYDKAAIEYDWEIYDNEKKAFVAPNTESLGKETDELGRQVETLSISASSTNQMVRCKIKTGEGEIEETAYVFPLKEIESISIDKEMDIDAGRYISSSEIPVNITYKDKSKETVQGLNGLYFFTEKEEDCEVKKDDSGKRKVIKTITITESEYERIDIEDKEVTLIYGEEEFTLTLHGKDLREPEIKEVKTDYEDNGAKVKIDAIDDISALPELTYAIKKQGEKVKDKDFIYTDSFTIDKDDYGAYTVYVKDTSGNIQQQDLTLEVKDDTPPEIVNIRVIEDNKGGSYED